MRWSQALQRIRQAASLHNLQMILQVAAGIRREKIDELQVEQALTAVHKAAVLVEYAGEAPSLTKSQARSTKTTARSFRFRFSSSPGICAGKQQGSLSYECP